MIDVCGVVPKCIQEEVGSGLENIVSTRRAHSGCSVTSHAPKMRERRGSHGWNVCQPYTGTITQYDPFKSNPFFVEYDDGEMQWEAAEDVRPIGSFIDLESEDGE